MWTALHGLSRLRLRSDRWRGTILTLGRRPRVLATACWRFPIYSQSFVYQELTQLLHQGYDLKFLYSELERRDRLPAQFEALWRGRRRMFLTPYGHEADVEHYRSRMPDRVEVLVQLLCAASGLTPPELERHPHFRQSFSYARVVEAFRPRYLHSYFFYEGTLFTFVASYLLRVPRGVSCYADHLLQDYDLKVVAVHLRHCALVVATSQRIKRELLQIAPGLDADRILVKPNAINASRFPIAERRDPAAGEPYRLVSVCRLDPKKGLAYLVRAVRILRDQGLNVEAHVVGGVDPDQPASADYARELEADVRALDLTRWVHLDGRRTEAEVSGFLQRSHLFVAPFVEMPSGDKDGIPTTLLEAMSTGLAAVATDAGSMTEVVEDGVDGVIVPQRNPQALAAAIAELLEDPARRARLGTRAAETARSRFDVSVCEHLFHAALEQVLARPYADAVRPGEMMAQPPPKPTAPEPPSIGATDTRPAEAVVRPGASPLPNDLVLTIAARNPIRLEPSTLEAVLTRPWRGHAAARPAGAPAAPPQASLVVVTFNNLVFSRMCVESVLANTGDLPYELVVVDNGSTDGTPEYLRTLAADGAPLRVIANEGNRGFAPAVNQGLLASSGAALVLLNNDTIVPDGWLPRLLRHLDASSAGLVGPLTNRVGNEAQIEVPYRTYGELQAFARAQAEACADRAFHIRTLAMFCVAMRREVYERVGALDERFEIGLFEDDDYAVRVRAAGYTVRCAEDAFVHHFGQASFGQLPGEGAYGALFHANRRRWEEKWGRTWQPYERRRKPAYEALLAEIRAVVRETVPEHATVAVVSKGDNGLLELAGRRAWHFPQDETGEYTGYHPRSGPDVIAMLERVRSRGAAYFLLPGTSMWWLDHYAGLDAYLRSRYRVVMSQPSTCLLVSLTEPAAADTDQPRV
jgi:glycosyltransferase involved in cell wall biosynthesis/GT2 family glycosyltransferase